MFGDGRATESVRVNLTSSITLPCKNKNNDLITTVGTNSIYGHDRVSFVDMRVETLILQMTTRNVN